MAYESKMVLFIGGPVDGQVIDVVTQNGEFYSSYPYTVSTQPEGEHHQYRPYALRECNGDSITIFLWDKLKQDKVITYLMEGYAKLPDRLNHA